MCVCVEGGGGWGFEHRLARKELRMRRVGREGWWGGLRGHGRHGRRRVFVPVPALCSPADPLQLTGGFLLSSQKRDEGW